MKNLILLSLLLSTQVFAEQIIYMDLALSCGGGSWGDNPKSVARVALTDEQVTKLNNVSDSALLECICQVDNENSKRSASLVISWSYTGSLMMQYRYTLDELASHQITASSSSKIQSLSEIDSVFSNSAIVRNPRFRGGLLITDEVKSLQLVDISSRDFVNSMPLLRPAPTLPKTEDREDSELYCRFRSRS